MAAAPAASTVAAAAAGVRGLCDRCSSVAQAERLLRGAAHSGLGTDGQRRPLRVVLEALPGRTVRDGGGGDVVGLAELVAELRRKGCAPIAVLGGGGGGDILDTIAAFGAADVAVAWCSGTMYERRHADLVLLRDDEALLHGAVSQIAEAQLSAQQQQCVVGYQYLQVQKASRGVAS